MSPEEVPCAHPGCTALATDNCYRCGEALCDAHTNDECEHARKSGGRHCMEMDGPACDEDMPSWSPPVTSTSWEVNGRPR